MFGVSTARLGVGQVHVYSLALETLKDQEAICRFIRGHVVCVWIRDQSNAGVGVEQLV